MKRGVRRLVVAGGETSGAVVQALGIEALAIGPQIDPGVPWTASLGDPAIALALKSGNFGAEDFFEKALRMLDSAGSSMSDTTIVTRSSRSAVRCSSAGSRTAAPATCRCEPRTAS